MGIDKRAGFVNSSGFRICCEVPCRGVAQPGSAPASGAGGRRFESSHPDHSVQDPGVPSRMPGSSSFWGSIAGGVARTSDVRRHATALLVPVRRGRPRARRVHASLPGATSTGSRPPSDSLGMGTSRHAWSRRATGAGPGETADGTIGWGVLSGPPTVRSRAPARAMKLSRPRTPRVCHVAPLE